MEECALVGRQDPTPLEQVLVDRAAAGQQAAQAFAELLSRVLQARFERVDTGAKVDAIRLLRLAIVGIGRDFVADLAVASVGLYRTA